VIFKDFNTTGDGIVTGVQLAGIVKNRGKSLSELASIMKELPQVLVNVKIPNEMKKIHETDEEVKSLIRSVEEKLEGKGRVLIRPSGTEPLVRIMLEGEDLQEITEAAENIADLIKSRL
jgi:phosphoglucosamine mutase